MHTFNSLSVMFRCISECMMHICMHTVYNCIPYTRASTYICKGKFIIQPAFFVAESAYWKKLEFNCTTIVPVVFYWLSWKFWCEVAIHLTCTKNKYMTPFSNALPHSIRTYNLEILFFFCKQGKEIIYRILILLRICEQSWRSLFLCSLWLVQRITA